MIWVTSYLSLGSNVGRRKKNLFQALEYLKKHPGIITKKVSSFYAASAIGPKQRSFYNCATLIKTSLKPMELLRSLKTIEKKMKRRKTIHWGPRIIDLDIVSYGTKKMRSRYLTLPHKEFHKRKFVLEPLKEINPKLKLPGFKKTVTQILHELTDDSQRVKLVL